MRRNYKKDHARKMMTQKEITDGVLPYDSRAWELRKKSRKDKEIKRMIDAAKKRAEEPINAQIERRWKK